MDRQKQLELAKQILAQSGNKPLGEQTSSFKDEYNKRFANNTNELESDKNSAVVDLGVGVFKGLGSSIKGMGELGSSFTGVLEKGINKVAGFDDSQTNVPAIFKEGTPESMALDKKLEGTNSAQNIGKGVEQIAEYLVPIGKVSKANKVFEVGGNAIKSGLVSTTQEGGFGKDTGIAVASEVALPVVGKVVKPVVNIAGRILKGTGVALSGASASKLDDILKNPEVALMESKNLNKKGNDFILKQNVDKIMSGVSNLRKNAVKEFGDAIEGLKQVDIDPKAFKTNTQKILDKYQSSVSGSERILSNVDFNDPKNLQKASSFIDKLSTVNLNGKDLRKLTDDIESSIYKVATSDERLSYNVFVRDLAKSLKKSIIDSTDKLNEMNKKYSDSIQLAKAIQKELGKVEFKNLEEVVNVSKNVEKIFDKSGLAPGVIDDFLSKIGATDLKTSEAVRQISKKELPSNTPGANPFEFFRNFTSAVVTPKMVKDIAIYTKLSEQKVSKLLNELSPVGRATFIETLNNISDK
jgi:hypothetical protein